jgi:hypothetical protein
MVFKRIPSKQQGGATGGIADCKAKIIKLKVDLKTYCNHLGESG